MEEIRSDAWETGDSTADELAVSAPEHDAIEGQPASADYPVQAENKSLAKSGMGFLDKHIGLVVIGSLCVAWAVAAGLIGKPLVLPDFFETLKQFLAAWTDERIMRNLFITMRRVLVGAFMALIVSCLIGYSMGYSQKALRALSPIINSIRQVPIMAWVPLAIVWFGLGEGPTVFLIFMSAVFPLTLNIIAAISEIDPNYINAARSMGASTASIIKDIIIPGSLPGLMTGIRLGVGAGWMSVICAEFIATSAGLGFLMIEAQERLLTSRLYALMIMSAIVGYIIDRLIQFIDHRVTSWRYKEGPTKG